MIKRIAFLTVFGAFVFLAQSIFVAFSDWWYVHNAKEELLISKNSLTETLRKSAQEEKQKKDEEAQKESDAFADVMRVYNDTESAAGVMRSYRNDIFGIAFDYPEEWGDVVINHEEITNLQNYVAGLSDEEKQRVYANVVSIEFANRDALTPKLVIGLGDTSPWRDLYSVDGDFLSALLVDRSACRESSMTSSELTHCWRLGSIVAALENDKNFENRQYDMSLVAYRSVANDSDVRNGITLFVRPSYVNSIDQRITTVQDFYAVVRAAKENQSDVHSLEELVAYAKMLNAFWESVELFVPAQTVIAPENIATDDKAVRRVIRYYAAIERGDFATACAQKRGKSCSKKAVAKVRALYGDTYYARVMHFFPEKNQIVVSYREHNKMPQQILVEIALEKKKLQLERKGIVRKFDALDDGARIMTLQHDRKVELIYEKGERRIVIDSGHDGSIEPTGSSSFVFSQIFLDRYIYYAQYGWEWGAGRVYDLAQQKVVYTGAAPTYDFSAFVEGQWITLCNAQSDFSGSATVAVFDGSKDFAKVFDVYDFLGEKYGRDIVYANGGYYVRSCDYDATKKVLAFVLARDGDEKVSFAIRVAFGERVEAVLEDTNFSISDNMEIANQKFSSTGNNDAYSIFLKDNVREVRRMHGATYDVIAQCPYETPQGVNTCYFTDLDVSDGFLLYTEHKDGVARKIVQRITKDGLQGRWAIDPEEYIIHTGKKYILLRKNNYPQGGMYRIVDREFSTVRDMTEVMRKLRARYKDVSFMDMTYDERGFVITVYIRQPIGKSRNVVYHYDVASGDVTKIEDVRKAVFDSCSDGSVLC